MELEPVAGVRRDEGAPSAVLLDPEVLPLCAGQRGGEVGVVEHEAEVVDPWELPLPRLDDDVDGAPLELAEPQLEAHTVELAPRDAGLERHGVLADAAVPRDEVEAELRDVARLDVPDPAGHEVVVEEPHSAAILDSGCGRSLAPDELAARAPPAGSDAPRRCALRAPRPHAAAPRNARRALAPVALRARAWARPTRAGLPDRRLRGAGVPELPHAPAR